MKKWLLCLLAVLMVLPLAACSVDAISASDKAFLSNGLEITLTSAFSEKEAEAGYTIAFDSTTVCVRGLKELYSSDPQLENMTLDKYTEKIYEKNSALSPKPIDTVDGLPIMEYELHNDQQNRDYSYFTTMFKGDDCFWLLQFACETKNYEEYRPYFIKWAKTVTLTSATV